MKIYFKLFLLSALTLLFAACSHSDDENLISSQKSIVILYENDVHCNIQGYQKLAGLRDAIANSDTAYAGIVSCGDYLNGGVVGAASKGQYIVDIMRNMCYDAITIGNHEFDFGLQRMKELLKNVNAPVVCANLFDYGETTPFFAPYVIKRYGKKKVAFIGVCTPETELSEGYAVFDKEGNKLCDFRSNEVYQIVQQAVDKARGEGADYVVVLSHLGEQQLEGLAYSHGLVAATSGIDVVLDGHSHATIAHEYVKNKEGKMIIVSQSGTKFENVGKLVITKDGILTTELVPMNDINYANQFVANTTDSIKSLLEEMNARIIATSEFDLQINGPDGKRQVRNQETNLGDLITDAYRNVLKADIGIQNGGGIRSFIKAGDISYGNVFDVLSFSNVICKIQATGEQIWNMLEKSTAAAPGEDGNFPQVSGMRFTVHTASHTVSDVLVIDAEIGAYRPLENQKTYTIALNDYYSGGGYYNMLKDCKLLENNGYLDRDVVADYLQNTLGGVVGNEYAKPQGRIILVDD